MDRAKEVVGRVHVNPEEIEYNLALADFEYPRLKELGSTLGKGHFSQFPILLNPSTVPVYEVCKVGRP